MHKQAQLNCSVEEGRQVGWQVSAPGEPRSLDTQAPSQLNTLKRRGINPEFDTLMMTSALNIEYEGSNGEINNGTYITCESYSNNDSIRLFSERVTVIFYG